MFKFASTALVRKFKSGVFDLSKVENIVKRLTNAGHTVTPRELVHLGMGAEGAADLVTHHAGLAVQKAYNSAGPFFSQKLINAKNKIMKTKLNGEKLVRYYGNHPTAPNVHYYQYIRPTPGGSQITPDITKTLNSVENRVKGGIDDVLNNPSNIVGNTVIDFLPKRGYKTSPISRARVKLGKQVLDSEIKLTPDPYIKKVLTKYKKTPNMDANTEALAFLSYTRKHDPGLVERLAHKYLDVGLKLFEQQRKAVVSKNIVKKQAFKLDKKRTMYL